MSFSVNSVTLLGTLGRDPESRSFQNGGKVVNLRVATSESWKNKTTGERMEKTEWHQVSVFNDHLGNYAERHLRKGSKVYLVGQLQTRKWSDSQGQDRYTTEIVLQGYDAKLIGLDGKAEVGERKRGYDEPTGGGGHVDPFNAELDDSDVPFISAASIW